MTIYEKIKSVSNDTNKLAEVLYNIYERDDTDICLYCNYPNGNWCTDRNCIDAFRKVLTEVNYSNV